jgi:integrase
MQQLKMKLYPVSRDLTTQWFIKYSKPEGSGYDKAYINSNDFPTLNLRLAEAERRMQVLRETWQNNVNVYHKDLLNDLYSIIELRCSGLKEKSKHSYWGFFHTFMEWYLKYAKDIDQNKIGSLFLKYLLQKKYSNTTYNNYRKTLKSFFADLLSFHSGKYNCNTFLDIRSLPEQRESKKWFTPEMQKKIKTELTEKDNELWLACLLQYYCFIRPNELRQIRIENINFETKKFQIKAASAKNSKVEYIPICDALLLHLLPYKNLQRNWFLFSVDGCPGEKMYGRDHLSNRHKKFTNWLQFEKGYTFYSWKNTGAVELIKNGTHMKVISMLMRHSSIEITDEYLKSLGIDDLITQSMIHYKIL